MPAPSQLAIQSSALQRLVKEEASYHKELEQQEVRIAKLEQGDDDENAEYTLRQEASLVKHSSCNTRTDYSQFLVVVIVWPYKLTRVVDHRTA
jgi:hypothetical protein